MAQLIYSAITSLDLYVEDARGGFAWSVPDAEVHAFVNELERPIGTYLYGRRMYQTMRSWQTEPSTPDAPAVLGEYAEIWRAAEKVVYSRLLHEASTPRTRIERVFTAEGVLRLKAAAEADLTVGGAQLAGAALRAGLVDEIRLLVAPVVLGDGKPALPRGLPLDLHLLDERRFSGGTVHLRYAVAQALR